MKWNHALSYFFGGAFLANSVPHFVSGVMGRSFPTPFASPPGQGLSPAWVNVLWGLFNVVVAYLLLCRVGDFSLRRSRDVAIAVIGALIMSVMLAMTFSQNHLLAFEEARQAAVQHRPVALWARGARSIV